MNQTDRNPKIAQLVHRLTEYEGGRLDPGTSKFEAILCVTEKLRKAISSLTGVEGYRVLLGRAIVLTKRSFPESGKLQAKPDGSLEGFNEAGDSTPGFEAINRLTNELLVLLATFVGENLVLTLVKSAWPGCDLSYKVESNGDDGFKKQSSNQ